jgi:hypothetical protein
MSHFTVMIAIFLDLCATVSAFNLLPFIMLDNRYRWLLLNPSWFVLFGHCIDLAEYQRQSSHYREVDRLSEEQWLSSIGRGRVNQESQKLKKLIA